MFVAGLFALATLGITASPIPGLAARAWAVRETPTKAEVIVVLGGGTTWPGVLLCGSLMRLQHGVWLYHQGYAPRLIVSGGGDPRHPAVPPEAELMRRFALMLGVNSEHVVVEPRATGTYENGTEVATIMRREGWQTALLVTDAVHMRRARMVFERLGIQRLGVINMHPRAAKLIYYIRTVANWPELIAMHLIGRPLDLIRLRDGHTIHLLDARAEIWAFDSIYRQQCYNVDFPDIARDGVVIDLGANVGIYTLFAATRLVSRGRVLAVEANPECFGRLQQTVRRCTNVTTWCGAVAGTGKLWLAADSLGASIFRSGDSHRSIDATPISTKDVLDFAPRIALLKANIEGAEYPMLLESPDEAWSAVERLAIKWHKDAEIAHGHQPEDLTRRLERLGFRILRHEEIWRGPDLTTGITTATRAAPSRTVGRGWA